MCERVIITAHLVATETDGQVLAVAGNAIDHEMGG